MEPDELRIEQLEESFPSLSGSAFSAGFHEALDAGLRVLIAEEGTIYEVAPDGKRRKIGKTGKPTKVTIGSRVTLR